MKVIMAARAGHAALVTGGTPASVPSSAARHAGAPAWRSPTSPRPGSRPEPAVQGEIMASRLNPYLSFNGNARQAMEFYASVFGGTLNMNTFADYGGQGADAGRIMHAMLETDAGLALMGADVTSEMEYHPPAGFSISLSGDNSDGDQLRGYFTNLSAGGTVTMPLDKQVWGDEFGMCVDQFGISWLVNISQQQT